jgi:hypothetical protein
MSFWKREKKGHIEIDPERGGILILRSGFFRGKTVCQKGHVTRHSA